MKNILHLFKAKKSKFSNRKIFWFDTETSGTDPKLHGIVQLACLIEVDGKVIDQFESKVRLFKNKQISPEALEVTGYTEKQIREEFPSPHDVYKNLRSFLAKHGRAKDKLNRFVMAGYNSKFDCDMLSQWIQDLTGGPYEYWDYFQFKPIDVLPLMTMLSYAGIIDVENEKLETIAKYFGVEINAHDALSDVKATREITNMVMMTIYNSLTGCVVPILGLKKEPCSCVGGCESNE